MPLSFFKVLKIAIFLWFWDILNLFLGTTNFQNILGHYLGMKFYSSKHIHTFLYLEILLSLSQVSEIAILDNFGLFLAYFQVPKIFKMSLDTIIVCNSTHPNIFIHFYTYIRHCHTSKSQKRLFLAILGYFKPIFRTLKFSKCVWTLSWNVTVLSQPFSYIFILI